MPGVMVSARSRLPQFSSWQCTGQVQLAAALKKECAGLEMPGRRPVDRDADRHAARLARDMSREREQSLDSWRKASTPMRAVRQRFIRPSRLRSLPLAASNFDDIGRPIFPSPWQPSAAPSRHAPRDFRRAPPTTSGVGEFVRLQRAQVLAEEGGTGFQLFERQGALLRVCSGAGEGEKRSRAAALHMLTTIACG